MSRFEMEELECPECHTRTRTHVYHSINVTVDPELKTLVLRNEFNRFECAKCHASAPISLPVLYHDMRQDFWIWMTPEGEFDPVKADDPLRLSPAPIRESILKKKSRDVRSRNELIEKILLFDAGLDDYTFEYMKLRFLQEQPELAAYEIFFDRLEGDGLHCVALKDGRQFALKFPRDIYDGSAEQLRALAFDWEPGSRWPRVNQERVGDILVRLTRHLQ